MFERKLPADYALDLGLRLKALRLQRNIKQGALARDAGVSAPTLGALENQGRGTVETLARVMYALGREGELEGLLLPDAPSSLDQLGRPSRRQRAGG